MKRNLRKTAIVLLFILIASSFSFAYGQDDDSAYLVSMRLGTPMLYDMEFEYVIPSGWGFSIGGSSLSASDSDTDYSLTYMNVGAKKYFGDETAKGLFVAGRFGIINWDAEEDVRTGVFPNYVINTYEGDASMTVIMGTVGYRWVWGGFTLCPELGFGSYALDKMDLKYMGVEREWDVDISGTRLSINLSLGAKF